MRFYLLAFILGCATAHPYLTSAQTIERITFDAQDSTDGFYLAIRPQSKQVKGVLVLLSSFLPPENLLTETKLHNTASANDLLTVVASMNGKLYADSVAVERINKILRNIVKRFSADTSKFALAGYDEAGNIALRYTEFTYERPQQFPLQPKAVFGIDAPVDLFGFWKWAEGQIKKNFWPGAVNDAKYYLEAMTKENGTIQQNPERYKALTPFFKESEVSGNEKYLKNVAVRLYYDVDIDWQLQNRRNSFYDTKMPDGSELISRLLRLGNNRAEFVASKQPGVRSNGMRNPNALSIVDEVDCVQWLKSSLGVFDAATWKAPYHLPVPEDWSTELFTLPPDFAPQMAYKGVEDLRFTPGWGDSTSAQYWSYGFLWWLDGSPKIDAETLQGALQAYYAGLVGRNITGRNIPENKVVPTSVAVTKAKPAAGTRETYRGRIHMLDYMTQKPIVLNALIQVLPCEGENNRAVLISISPKGFGDDIWKAFTAIGQGFQCAK